MNENLKKKLTTDWPTDRPYFSIQMT